MAEIRAQGFDPVPIGEVVKPPFAQLPDPLAMFARRSRRLKTLADGHALRSYLLLLAELSDMQHRVQEGLPDVVLPSAGALARSRQHRMPPLDRSRFTADAAMDGVWQRLTTMAEAVAMPDAARVALQRVKSAAAADRAVMMSAVLSHAAPVDGLAEHVFVAAALQVHFARLAARFEAGTLVPVGDGVCPACGGAPVSSMVVGWSGAQGARFCACSLCGTLLNYPRVKCTLCGATKGIAYQEIAGGLATVKAETCESCRGYVKILHQHKDPSLDPIADDVATVALDMLLRDLGYRRGAVDPFLLGY